MWGDSLESISNQIKSIRQIRNVSQEGLAQLTGMDIEVIKSIEEKNNLEEHFSVLELKKITDALNFSIYIGDVGI